MFFYKDINLSGAHGSYGYYWKWYQRFFGISKPTIEYPDEFKKPFFEDKKDDSKEN